MKQQEGGEDFGKERGHGLGGKKGMRKRERNEETRKVVRCSEKNKEIKQELGGRRNEKKRKK